jgi:hypothetical protein
MRPPCGALIADAVSLIQHNPLKGSGSNGGGIQSNLGIRGEPHSASARASRNGVAAGLNDTVATGAQLTGPPSDKSRRANNECSKRPAIFEEPNGLKGLAETHIVCKNTTTAQAVILATDHPANTLSLVRQVVDTDTGRNESHFVSYRNVSKRPKSG